MQLPVKINSPRFFLILLLLCIFCIFPTTANNLRPKTPVFWGDWFAYLETTGSSASTYHLRLSQPDRFHLYRIVLHPRLHWEETRYEGKIVHDNEKVRLDMESCSVYTSRRLSFRRALLRKFDCDHIQMELRTWEEERVVLSPNEYGGKEETVFFRPPHSFQGKWFRIFPGEEDNVGLFWGVGVKWMQDGSPMEIWKPSGKLGTTRMKKMTETSGEFFFDGANNLSPGDFLLYKGL